MIASLKRIFKRYHLKQGGLLLDASDNPCSRSFKKLYAADEQGHRERV